MRLDQAVDQRLADAADRHATGQISAVVGTKITVTTTGGASLTIPRLTSWTPSIGDMVVIAKTPGGWIALGRIA